MHPAKPWSGSNIHQLSDYRIEDETRLKRENLHLQNDCQTLRSIVAMQQQCIDKTDETFQQILADQKKLMQTAKSLTLETKLLTETVQWRWVPSVIIACTTGAIYFALDGLKKKLPS